VVQGRLGEPVQGRGGPRRLPRPRRFLRRRRRRTAGLEPAPEAAESAALLADLERALVELVAALSRDPRCGWTSLFAHGLAWCRDLRARAEPPADSEIAALRRWLLGPFRGGAGQFNDYVPVLDTDDPGVWVTAPWDDEVCAARDRLRELADRLPG
jgi:hypothetical protein